MAHRGLCISDRHSGGGLVVYKATKSVLISPDGRCGEYHDDLRIVQ